MRHSERIVGGISIVLVVLCVPSMFAASFQGLGNLHGIGSSAAGVSADGSVVVGYDITTGGEDARYKAFRWTSSEGMVDIGDLSGGSIHSYATGVSADGSVVVGASASLLGMQAFRWTSSYGMVGLGDLSGGDYYSEAFAVSADGSVVVGRSFSSNGCEAFRWTSGEEMVGLGDFAGGDFWSEAHGVSADGLIVVGQGWESSVEAFRWTPSGGMGALGYLPDGLESKAYAISADGTSIVGESYSGLSMEAFRWRMGEDIIGLGDLPGGLFQSEAHGVSAAGSVVVGYGYTDSGFEAFYWTASDGMRKVKDILVNDFGIDLTGWTLSDVSSISKNGFTMVGNGFHNGKQEAWIANLITCTAPLAMDFNNDCKVNFADFAIFAQSWLACNLQPQAACWQ